MLTHQERLTTPLSWWLAAFAFAATCGWIVLVIGGWVAAAIATATVAAALIAAVTCYGSFMISYGHDGLRAGVAHLPAHCVGTAEPLHRAEYRRRLGVDADVRGYLATRPYIDRGVLVTVDDPQDPAPYWLMSSRHPDELAAAINAPLTSQEGPTRGEEER